jgi:DMSO/TMAO reductase YedYZ molybdopterin-dependent catalytic subunit
MPRRLSNDVLLGLAIAQVATGLIGWAWPVAQVLPIYDLHRALGVALLLTLVWKQVIVRRSLTYRFGRDGSVAWGLAAGVGLLGCLGLGLAWTLNLFSFESFWGYSPLNIHVALGIGLLPLVASHAFLRRTTNVGGGAVLARRALLRTGGLALATLLGWRLMEGAAAALTGAGIRQATGSKHAGSFSGNNYPNNIWLLDEVPVLDASSWRMQIGGRVRNPTQLSYTDLAARPAAAVQAVIDCTGGWWSEQVWSGCSVGDVLAQAEPLAGAREAAVLSVTGHRMVFPLEELRAAVLATHVGGEPLSIPHGFPVRLAAPGRRGYYWVKWLQRIDVL